MSRNRSMVRVRIECMVVSGEDPLPWIGIVVWGRIESSGDIGEDRSEPFLPEHPVGREGKKNKIPADPETSNPLEPGVVPTVTCSAGWQWRGPV